MNDDSSDPINGTGLGVPQNTYAETEPGGSNEGKNFHAHRSEQLAGRGEKSSEDSRRPDDPRQADAQIIDATRLRQAKEQVEQMANSNSAGEKPPTLQQLYDEIDQLGPLQGSHKMYSPEELKEKVQNAPLDEITRAGGLRDKVQRYREQMVANAASEHQQKAAENSESHRQAVSNAESSEKNRPRRSFKEGARKVGAGILNFLTFAIGGDPHKFK